VVRYGAAHVSWWSEIWRRHMNVWWGKRVRWVNRLCARYKTICWFWRNCDSREDSKMLFVPHEWIKGAIGSLLTVAWFVSSRPGHSVNRNISVRFFGFFESLIFEKWKPKLCKGKQNPKFWFLDFVNRSLFRFCKFWFFWFLVSVFCAQVEYLPSRL
jgi:hypothetical protein